MAPEAIARFLGFKPRRQPESLIILLIIRLIIVKVKIIKKKPASSAHPGPPWRT
jgi:hypothetical protein